MNFILQLLIYLQETGSIGQPYFSPNLSDFRFDMTERSENRDGSAFIQTLQGLPSKKKILDIHRRYLRVQQKDVQSDEEAETLWRQYLEFIVVKTHHRDTSGVGTRFSATPEVDALWHTHLLNT